jgi:CubicO group peptidase (beta-lactamase class C family)
MKDHKSYCVFLTLSCLMLALVLMHGKVNASLIQQTETDFNAIDAYIEDQMDNLGIPGMALGIIQDGQIAHLQGFGVADSSGRVVTSQTPFIIASISKTFTALAVMQLVEAGKLELDEPVQKYLPWFELADKEVSATITIRNLLNHTSGISQKDGDVFMGSTQELEEVVRGLNKSQLTQPVGTSFQYSNLNYMIAGLLVEQVSGQSYADYVTEHIFEPLDMTHSYASHELALTNGLAEGHHYMLGHAFAIQSFPSPAITPAGGLSASVEDLSHYAIAQLNDGHYGEPAILSPQGIVELHTPAILVGGNDYYAIGWIIGTIDDIPAVWHGGIDVSNLAMLILMPNTRSGVVLLSNANGFMESNQVVQIAKGVVSLLNGQSPAPISLPISSQFLYWAVLLSPFLMILGIAYGWQNRRNKSLRHTLVVVLLYGGVALFWLFGVPQLTAPIWLTLRIWSPEFAYSLIAAATLGIGWSMVYTMMNLRASKSK